MTNVNKKSVMAEMLVRQVLGESESFEQVCAQRGVSIEDAVRFALRTWAGQNLRVVQPTTIPGLLLDVGLVPDPGDCPVGQEAHWLAMCEHDLAILQKRAKSCFQMQDTEGLNTMAIAMERYIQAIDTLKARVA